MSSEISNGVGSPPVRKVGSASASAWADGLNRRFVGIVVLVTLAFLPSWIRLARDAWADALHSYAVAIPFVCWWLVSEDRKREEVRPAGGPGWSGWFVAGVLAVGALVAGFAAFRWRGDASGWDLTLGMLGWVLGIWSGALVCFGPARLRSYAFTTGFLLATVPLPLPAVDAIEIFLQQTTSGVVEMVFQWTGTTYHRKAGAFWLPGLRFEVAQECSGIRSTVVLFVVSLVGAKILLRTWVRRSILVLAIVPLGIARNAFRICVLTLLSVHVDPRIVDSALHHRGGPLFFAIFLVPLFLLFYWLQRQEIATRKAPGTRPVSGPPSASNSPR